MTGIIINVNTNDANKMVYQYYHVYYIGLFNDQESTLILK